MADVDFSSPSVSQADFALSATDATEPTTVVVEIDASQGGSLETPDGRVRLDIPPLALTGDCEVTIKQAETPVASQGSVLNLDPDLGATANIVAVGPEIEIELRPLPAGSPVPRLLGPVLLTHRYSAADAAAANVEQSVLAPYYYDGTQWTLPDVVPYLHAVDEINRVAVTGIDLSTSVTGESLVAEVTNATPLVLAQAGGGGVPGLDPLRRFVVHVAAKIKAQFQPPVATTIPLRTRPGGSYEFIRERTNPNALPLLVFHGWDPINLIIRNSLDLDPLSSDRYGQIIRDLVAATAGVYQPVYVTYNSKAETPQVSQRIQEDLEGKLGDEFPKGLRGIPNPDKEDSGKFESLNSFGFSKGGLAERQYQCQSRRVTGMVAVASPHHGALERLQSLLTVGGFFEDFLLPLFRKASPGTAELLDYRDNATPEDSGNPFLWRLNNSFCSAPRQRLSLVAGNDPSSLVPKAGPTLEGWIDEAVQAGVLAPEDRDDFEKVRAALSLGEVLVGEASDTIVPVRSAKALRRDGSSRVLALSQMPDDSVSEKVLTFTHFNLGHADGVPISVFMDTDILPALDDWVVEKMVDEVDFAEPSDTEDGHVRVDVVVDWHVPHGSVTGVLPVVYTRDGDQWTVVSGADPESLEPNASKAFSLEGGSNSLTISAGDKTIEIDEKLDAGTDVDGYGILLVNLPIQSEEGTVPADPTEAGFGLP